MFQNFLEDCKLIARPLDALLLIWLGIYRRTIFVFWSNVMNGYIDWSQMRDECMEIIAVTLVVSCGTDCYAALLKLVLILFL